MKYKIYQIKDSKFEACDYVFRDFETAKKMGFTLDDYDVVYEGDFGDVSHCTKWMILDDLFYIFNQDKPHDFHGHSLSVSDVAELEGELYYCDDFGWEKI